jgi:formate-dependent nitrite reductase cytochrome c552 subunit
MKRKLEKPYRHPIGEAKGVHNAYEEMPESGSGVERHVECVDCHSPHYMRADRKFAGLKGVTKSGISGVWARAEYEVCFNCHSDSYNLPVGQTNKRLEFAETNPSYHPVIAEGKNSFVPSLIYTRAGDVSKITCSDCHNNDNKRGLQGPHASNYPAILARNYSISDNVDESPQSYDLCYGCHKRSSILGDISFKYHSLHIKGDLVVIPQQWRLNLSIKGSSKASAHFFATMLTTIQKAISGDTTLVSATSPLSRQKMFLIPLCETVH